jgi:hypothetical protein
MQHAAKRDALPSDRWFQRLLCVQGGYYFVTGVWPLVSIRTFIMVTGEQGKTDHIITGQRMDHWLIMTAGVLITSISLALLTAAWRRTHVIELAVLAMAAAVGLTGIDAVYTARNVIPPIYLLDAVIEVLLLAAWGFTLTLRSRERISAAG